MNALSLNKEDALLLIIDIQEKLIPTMDAARLDKVVSQIGLLSLYASKEGLPVIMTEQYSKGLGKTIPSVMKHVNGINYEYFDKTSFGCMGDEKFTAMLKEKYPQKKIIVTGMETHICVYLTVLGLREEGFAVFVPQDAVIAHDYKLHENGLQLMDNAGATITNSESLVFQLMGSSGGETFKAVSGYLKAQSSSV
ncbi:MAG: isochorismatase family protein [bacterium]|nr:isochorismatase family protein [bacterium]MBU1917065.1 isochorismatase family protein [bacterium]